MSVHPEPTEKDKKIIKEKNTTDGKLICMVGNHEIKDISEIEYHHINPSLSDRENDVLNIATVCKKHHRELGQYSISELNALREIDRFFKTAGQKKLDDVIFLKTGRKNENISLDYSIRTDKEMVEITFENTAAAFPLSTCPSTGFKFFYCVLPVRYINNDTQLQPRPLELKRLWDLYRHLVVSSQLTPSVCRLENGMVYLFDGQHKAAAQIWAGRKEIECKIYLEPETKKLKETNLVAHDKLRQMPFFTSVLISKWASIFSEEWQQYMDLAKDKSETGFVSFLSSRGKKKTEAIHMIESNIYDSILEDDTNKVRKYLEDYSRDTKKPLTVGRLKQAFFKKFITSPPLGIDIEQSDRLRELERLNAIRLLNIVADYSLEEMWNPARMDENHGVSDRIYLNGSLKAVCSLIKDTVSNILELYDENERKEILLREISEHDWDLIEKSITLIMSHRVWQDASQENYNNLRMSNETLVRKYLSRRGLSTNWILNSSYETGNNFID
ncbi:MAG: hypothetical protein FJW66_00340 [Actinobacteria bacterium]|nr:hypothetical protein [Actinomycetota bacterium]